MVDKSLCLPLRENYLYAALLFKSPCRIRSLQICHFPQVNLIHFLPLLKIKYIQEFEGAVSTCSSWLTYSFVVGKALSLESEPSSLPASNIVRVLLLQVPNLVITLQWEQGRGCSCYVLCTSVCVCVCVCVCVYIITENALVMYTTSACVH